mgnify:CR=1 FL=1
MITQLPAWIARLSLEELMLLYTVYRLYESLDEGSALEVRKMRHKPPRVSKIIRRPTPLHTPVAELEPSVLS